jgi:hypothetical protein
MMPSRATQAFARGEEGNAFRHFLRDLGEDYAAGRSAEDVAAEQMEAYGVIPGTWLDAAGGWFDEFEPAGLPWFAAFRAAVEGEG